MGAASAATSSPGTMPSTITSGSGCSRRTTCTTDSLRRSANNGHACWPKRSCGIQSGSQTGGPRREHCRPRSGSTSQVHMWPPHSIRVCLWSARRLRGTRRASANSLFSTRALGRTNDRSSRCVEVRRTTRNRSCLGEGPSSQSCRSHRRRDDSRELVGPQEESRDFRCAQCGSRLQRRAVLSIGGPQAYLRSSATVAGPHTTRR